MPFPLIALAAVAVTPAITSTAAFINGAILGAGGTTATSAGIWYVFFKNKSSQHNQTIENEPVGSPDGYLNTISELLTLIKRRFPITQHTIRNLRLRVSDFQMVNFIHIETDAKHQIFRDHMRQYLQKIDATNTEYDPIITDRTLRELRQSASTLFIFLDYYQGELRKNPPRTDFEIDAMKKFTNVMTLFNQDLTHLSNRLSQSKNAVKSDGFSLALLIETLEEDYTRQYKNQYNGFFSIKLSFKNLCSQKNRKDELDFLKKISLEKNCTDEIRYEAIKNLCGKILTTETHGNGSILATLLAKGVNHSLIINEANVMTLKRFCDERNLAFPTGWYNAICKEIGQNNN